MAVSRAVRELKRAPSRRPQADLDLGNYERFVDVTLTRDHNITTGKIYQVRGRARRLAHALCAHTRPAFAQAVIEKERRGEYLGKTVQVVPHITDCVQDWISRVAAIPVDGQEGPPDVCVIELGGTVGACARACMSVSLGKH